MKILFVAGEPATGKTTLFRKVMSRLGVGSAFQYESTVKGIHYPETRVWVLGLYPEGVTFGGTDKLAMTLITNAIPWLETVPKKHAVLIEGDRLCNQRFFDACRQIGELQLFMLEANPLELSRRHKERGDTQSEQWLQSRRTKLENLKKKNSFASLPNMNQLDAERNAELLLDRLA